MKNLVMIPVLCLFGASMQAMENDRGSYRAQRSTGLMTGPTGFTGMTGPTGLSNSTFGTTPEYSTGLDAGRAKFLLNLYGDSACFYIPQLVQQEKRALTSEQMRKEAEQAEEYNATKCLLTRLAPEQLFSLISGRLHDNQVIHTCEDNLKNLMNLSLTCKQINALLSDKTIIKLCKDYPQEDKNQALQNLLKILNDPNYRAQRVYAFMLVHVGADVNTISGFRKSLLQKAVLNKDSEFANLLFDHGANPHIESGLPAPIFFYIKDVQVAEKCVKAPNFNINAVDISGTNVLWEVSAAKYSPELIRLYLAHGAQVDGIRREDGACILHHFASEYLDLDYCLQKAEMLLNVVPHLINALNSENTTPLDVVLASMTHYEKIKMGSKMFQEKVMQLESLANLYIKNGALRACELGTSDNDKQLVLEEEQPF